MVLNALVVSLLALSWLVAGCGSDEAVDPNESASTRAIREKVRQDMELDRLRSYGARLEGLNASLANAPTAMKLGAPGANAAADVPAANEAPVDSGEASGSAPAAAAIDLAAGGPGAELYVRNCASCHGPKGGGDGPVGKALVPRPAKFYDGEYMNALSNEHLVKVVTEGGASVGKSALMASWSGTMSKQEIRQVLAFVRSLAEPPYEGPMP
jgi:cytochrome c oxidase cbb3-type subunit 3